MTPLPEPSSRARAAPQCGACGKFMKCETGASWAQQWSYSMDGSPELHEPRWQCKPCTDQHGPLDTNCGSPERYSGVLK